MKKAILSSALMFMCILALAQAPESFNYQVVVRDGSSNSPLTNQNVSFRMSILKGSSSGESQYSELHSANTGVLGIVNLVIGNGTGKTGNITTIDLGADSYFLKVEIDKTGGTSYTEMGTTQLLSVPYALYSKKAGTVNETDPIFVAHPANGITGTNITNWNTAYGWGNHSLIGYVPGTRTLTINGTSLDLSDNRSWSVGTVTSVGLTLPSIFSVSGSPVTTSGTMDASLASQTANLVFASPDGGLGTPSFRALVANDIPNLDWSKITSGKPTTISGYGITNAVNTTDNQTIGGLKTFILNIQGNINGNAGTVTNGVYTNGSYADPVWITSLGGSKITGNISGNAGTVTNGVYTNGSYVDPVWITSLGGSKITGNISGNAGTVTNGVYTTGNQTIAGNKTFTGKTTVTTPVNATDAATKAYVDALKSLLLLTADPSRLLAAGISVADLLAAGVSVADLVAAGASIADLLAAGVSVTNLLAAGASVADLLAAGVSVTDLFNAGVGVGTLEQNGATSQALTNAGLIGTISDVGGNTYKWVKIGNQIWMAENLKYIPSVVGPGTGSQTTLYYYVYGYNGTVVANAKATANYTTYGVLYNWPAAMNGAASSTANPSGVQGVCPTGWHLPSDAEWTQLTNYLGGVSPGGKLKETGTAHWTSPNTGATNETGFTALPGGYRVSDGTFSEIGIVAYYWSTTEYSTSNAWGRGMNNGSSMVYRFYNHGKAEGFSVRCIKD